ncbi:hypothetical protein NIES4071_69250 [Calothrix sp. NIES-4071]|nr:hypothetical protein NIES4071_69250 [Calothrix sp. NIES-4071]BAZ61202.1 hypothetical protein NIES4105_69200 [Calothrix sp. NIES-4105]
MMNTDVANSKRGLKLNVKLVCQAITTVAFTTVSLIFNMSVQANAVQAATSEAPASFQLPNLTGPYQVGTTSYNFVDPERNDIYAPNQTDKRELMVQVFYPGIVEPGATNAPYLSDTVARLYAPALGLNSNDFVKTVSAVKQNAFSGVALDKTQESYPIVLFSPGFGALPESYSFQASELASHGYIVASISHTYDAFVTAFEDGRIVPQSPIFSTAPSVSELIKLINQNVDIRAADARFLLNQLEQVNANDPKSLLAGHLDLNNVGIFGHSLGGATAALAMQSDPRFKAGLNMDGTLFGNIIQDGLNRPFMLMNSENATNIDPTRQPFYDNLKNDAYNLTIKGTEHYNFSDLPLLLPLMETYSPQSAAGLKSTLGSINGTRGAQVINDYTTAFFNKYLKNQNQPLLSGASSDYPEVQFVARYATPTSIPEPSGAVGLITFFGVSFLSIRSYKHEN